MALANYTDLQTAVANWLQRTDLTAKIGDFITIAEAEFNRTLRLTGQITRADASVSDRWFDLTTLTVPLAEIRSVSITYGGVRTPLAFLPIEVGQTLYETREPRWYSRSGNELMVLPPPDATYTLELIYWRSVPDLASNATNWLLTLAPDLYLYRALLEGAHYIRDTDLAQRAETSYVRALEQLKSDDQRRQFGGSGLEVRAA